MDKESSKKKSNIFVQIKIITCSSHILDEQVCFCNNNFIITKLQDRVLIVTFISVEAMYLGLKPTALTSLVKDYGLIHSELQLL